jgi:predicted AAA+ superfamily ATPase
VDEDFPNDDVGRVLFLQDRVSAEVDIILQQAEEKGHARILSHYFRGAPACGKTVFLNMIAKELQKRGCDVYWLEHAGVLDNIPESEWVRLQTAAQQPGKKAVLVVDEVHEHPSSPIWHKLLRKSPNLIVVGAGIKKLSGPTSPKFRRKLPATHLLLTPGTFSLCCVAPGRAGFTVPTH